jgi:uncharacterized Rmd1/YagE family protein
MIPDVEPNPGRLTDLALPFRPSGVVRMQVRAVYLEGQISPREFRRRHANSPVLSTDPLILEVTPASYIVVTKFGGVVFWNCSPEAQRAWLAEIQEAMGTGTTELLDETIDVLVGTPENAVTFNEVSLRELSLPRMRILSLALAQSVALDYLEREVASALNRFEPVVTELEATGNLRLPVRDALRAIGFALKVRSSVLANLTLFDKPPETWESEMLERLDNQLYDFFDLEERLSAINQKVDYFTDMSSTLTGLLSQRRSWQLEIAVVVLILLEVVIFIWSLAK